MSYTSKDIMITFDDEVGVIYHTETGSFFTLTVENAKLLQEAQMKYENDTLVEEDRVDYIALFDDMLSGKPRRQRQDYSRIDEATSLEGLKLMVSTDCNLRCKYCYADGGSYGHARETITPEKAIAYIDAIILGKYTHLSTFGFFGGEPTLSPETIEAVCTHFRQLVLDNHLDGMPHFSMITNGTLIDQKLAGIIDEYDISLIISVDGPKEVNDAQRIRVDGSGSYDGICSSLQVLHESGVYPTLAEATYTQNHLAAGLTVDDVSAYVAEHLGIPRTIVVPCIDYGNSSGAAELAVELSEIEEVSIEDLMESFDALENIESSVFDDLFKIARMISGTYSNAVCAVGVASMTVFPNGEIYPCHLFGDNEEFIMGRIAQGVLTYNDAVLDRMYGYQKSEREYCRDCWQRTFCKGCVALDWIPHRCAELSERNKKVILALAKLRLNESRWDGFMEVVKRMDLSRFE